MLKLTPEAVDKALMLRDVAGAGEVPLRVSVQPGGCAGLRYSLYFDPETFDGDELLTLDGAGGRLDVVVDRASVAYLDQATLDYVESLERSGFVFDNPAASGGCSCGDSFC
jgi:iron-sulfur cluster assembly accessory protein